MLRALVPVALVAGAAVSVAAAAVSAAAKPSCGPASAHTLASDAAARVYTSRGSAYGCAVGGRRPVRLGRSGSTCVGSPLAGPVRLAGRDVALGLTSCGVDAGSALVEVRALPSGRILTRYAATTRVGVEGHQWVEALVVKADGAVAWIATAQAIGPPRFLRQLARVDRRGFAVLDSGRAVAPGSLTLNGSVLSWRDGRARRTASLR